MRYAVLTPTGFQMDGSEAKLYDTVEEAMEASAPGDNIFPVLDEEWNKEPVVAGNPIPNKSHVPHSYGRGK